MRLEGGITRRIEWPSIEFSAASLPGSSRDVVFLLGSEPQLKWRSFSAAVLGVAKALGVEMAITMGALLTDIPHTRPVRVTGTAADNDMVGRLGLRRSSYEGPTGIVGVPITYQIAVTNPGSGPATGQVPGRRPGPR